jgi:hypothetical protein
MQILTFRKHKRFIYSISFSADCWLVQIRHQVYTCFLLGSMAK